MRGQISGFILIAVLLIFAVGVLSYAGYFGVAGARRQITYPEGAQALGEYVTDCLADVTSEGIGLLGSQGGFVDLPFEIDREPTRYLAKDELGLAKVPLWHHEGRTYIPTLRRMQEDLAFYIEQEVVSCVDFTQFSDRYDVFADGNPEVRVEFTDSDTYVEMDWPLRAEQGEIAYDIDAYNAIDDARVKVAYELGLRLVDYEFATQALGNLTVQFLAIDPEIPMSGLLMDCGGKQWSLQEVKSRLESTIGQNLINIRVENTIHDPFLSNDRTYTLLEGAKERMYDEMIEAEETMDIEDTRAYPGEVPADVFEYQNMYFDVGAEDEDLRVVYQYVPEYGMSVRATPSSGDVLKSSDVRGEGMMKFLCMQQYHYTYDVSYPVLVSVQDPESGFVLEFGMPVQVDDNQAVVRRPQGNSFFDTINDEAFCRTGGQDVYRFKATGYDDEGFGGTLDDVNVSFICARRACDLGQTGPREGDYQLITRLPAQCDDPFIRMSRDGYLDNQMQIDSTRDYDVTLPLTRLKEMDVRVVKHVYFSQNGDLQGAEELEGENVTIFMDTLGEEHDQYVVYDPAGTTIEMVDGDASYSIDIVMTERDVMLGGYKNSNWTVSSSAIAGASEIVFHVFDHRPRALEESTQTDMMLYYITEDARLAPVLQ